MTADDEIQGLAGLLDRATDMVGGDGLGAAALAEARRRRVQRRVVGAASLAVLACVAGGVAVTHSGSDGRPQPVAPPSGTMTSAATTAPSVITWDPFTLTDAPLRPSGLPEQIRPPDDAPSVLDQPLQAAVLALPGQGHDVFLLGTDGSWRSVPGTADAVSGTLGGVVRPALTHDGTQVAMAVTDGLLVIDVTTGEDQLVPWPDPIAEPWDFPPSLLWIPGGEEIAVLHWKDTWVMKLDGSLRKPPWGRAYGLGLGVDPDGGIVEQAEAYGGFDVWRGDQLVRSLPSNYWTSSVTAGYGRIAFVGSGTRLPQGTTGPTLIDAATGDLVAAAPAADPNSVYGDGGHLQALGLHDADTLLMVAGPMELPRNELDEDTWYVVAWHADTGVFERLSSASFALAGTSFAAGLLVSP